jgi:glutamate 5-kinase
MLGADLVLVLTDVAGLYEKDPRTHPDAGLVRRLTSIDDELLATLPLPEVAQAAGGVGSGGMRSKLEAARSLLAAGITTVLCDGRAANVLWDAFEGHPQGTVIASSGSVLASGGAGRERAPR